MNQPKNDSRYEWTDHAWEKMQYYGISESRIKRIIRFPTRTEEGVAEETVAVMQPAGSKRYAEIWVMYSLARVRGNSNSLTAQADEFLNPKSGGLDNTAQFLSGKSGGKKIRIITAWRYPGKSPERDPVPQEVIQEIRSLL